MKHYLCFFLFFVPWLSLTVCAQVKPTPKDSTNQVNPGSGLAGPGDSFIPKVVPPSPDASSLGRYGEIPVELSRGTTSINIPLYEIESGSLKVPVSLSYHSGGVRVNDLASSAGLSWSLNAGGALTRAVNGLPDDNSFGFFSTPIPAESDINALLCYVGKLAAFDGSRMDGSQDSYFYNFNGSSGKFVYPNKKRTVDQDLASMSAVTIPYKPIKIQGTTFTDVDGTLYEFGKNVNGKISTENTSYIGSDISYVFTSTWYLSHMISANRMDTVYFEYTTPVNIISTGLWSTTLEEKISGASGLTEYSHNRSSANVTIGTIYPSNIYFKNGKVSFVYASDRQDVPGAARLTGIYIYKKEISGAYTEIKHYEPSHSYFNGTDGYSQADQVVSPTHPGSKLLKRLRLDSVTEKSPSADSLPPHQFTYYEDQPLPIYGSFAQDFWGFYNGAAGNQNLLIKDTHSNNAPTTANGANRLPNFSYAVSGALKTIKYPTSASTMLVYEPHQEPNGINGGGIRIKSISNMQGSGQLTKKNYTYPDGYITNNISAGNMDGLAYQFSMTVESFNNCASVLVDTYTSFPENYNFMLGSNSGSSMAYGTVEESMTDSNNNPLGKTVRSFKKAPDFTSSMFPFSSIINDWQRGQLLEEVLYNNENKVVKRTNNYYRTVLTDSLLRGYGARTTFKPLIGIFTSPGGAGCVYAYPSYCPAGDGIGTESSTTKHQWRYQALDQEIGAIFLDSTVSITYNETGSNSLKEKEEYNYATATHHQLTQKILTSSKNQALQTSYKYPHELAASNIEYQEMVNRHIYSPVIEEENKVAGIFTSLVRTNYKKWFPTTTFGTVQGFFAPLSVELQQSTGAAIPQIVFGEKLSNPTENGYDTRARPVVYTELNGTVSRLSWWQENGKQDLLNTHTVNGLFSTTYDYSPLVGMKSVTDPNGKALFYEYDGFSRLIKIRSNNAGGAVRKSYCYNYAGQTIACDAVAATGTVSPSQLLLLANQGGPLPVTLVNFNAIKEESTALLTWNTTAETNSERFDVEHSLNGKDWSRIGSVDAKGESVNMQYYSFKDGSPANGENLYRLKMVDRDNTFAYSRIQSLIFDNQVSVYPNPVTFGEKLNLGTPDPDKISHVKIYDIQGKLVLSANRPGRQLDVSSLQAGVYMVQLTAMNGSVSTHRIVKQ